MTLMLRNFELIDEYFMIVPCKFYPILTIIGFNFGLMIKEDIISLKCSQGFLVRGFDNL